MSAIKTTTITFELKVHHRGEFTEKDVDSFSRYITACAEQYEQGWRTRFGLKRISNALMPPVFAGATILVFWLVVHGLIRVF